MISHGTTPVCSPGQQAEIASRLVRAVPKAILFSGLDPKSVIKFSGRNEPLERALGLAFQMLHSGHADTAVPDWSTEPYNPCNWKIITHADNGSWRWDPNRVRHWKRSWQFRQEATVGTVVQAVAAREHVLNAKCAEYVAIHEYDVPENWHDQYVVFPGTVFEDEAGLRYVVGIYCGSRQFNDGKKRSRFVLKFDDPWNPDWIIATLKLEEL